MLSHCCYVQEDQKVAWLQDDIHCIRECQQKDAVISQLYHQLETLQQLQQQHVSDAARLVHPITDTSNADVRQKLTHLEMEVHAKRLEVEELRAKVRSLCLAYC